MFFAGQASSSISQEIKTVQVPCDVRFGCGPRRPLGTASVLTAISAAPEDTDSFYKWFFVGRQLNFNMCVLNCVMAGGTASPQPLKSVSSRRVRNQRVPRPRWLSGRLCLNLPAAPSGARWRWHFGGGSRHSLQGTVPSRVVSDQNRTSCCVDRLLGTLMGSGEATVNLLFLARCL